MAIQLHAETSNPKQVLFEDGFDQTEMNPRWLMRIPGENLAEWQLKKGVLHAKADAGKNGMLLLDQPDWSSYSVSVQFRFVKDQSRNLGLIFHGSPPKARHPAYFTGMIFSVRDTTAVLYAVDPVWRKLKTINITPLVDDRWYQLRVVVEDENMQCFIDDQLIIEEAYGKMPQGGAGLRLSSGAAAQLKNFKVVSVE
ncbi:MAG: family 16 glycoside hydrolase [Phycisphaeraceae bacterium JB051]